MADSDPFSLLFCGFLGCLLKPKHDGYHVAGDQSWWGACDVCGRRAAIVYQGHDSRRYACALHTLRDCLRVARAVRGGDRMETHQLASAAITWLDDRGWGWCFVDRAGSKSGWLAPYFDANWRGPGRRAELFAVLSLAHPALRLIPPAAWKPLPPDRAGHVQPGWTWADTGEDR